MVYKALIEEKDKKIERKNEVFLKVNLEVFLNIQL